MINQEQRPATVNVTIQAKRRIYYGLVSVAILSVVAVLFVLIYLQMSGTMALSQTAQVQPSPPVTEGQGQAQESRVREALHKEGYEQPLGNSDTAIRQTLGLKTNQGRVADFVGRHLSSRRWLVAESKGVDIESAVGQIRNTAQLLWRRGLGADMSNTELRLYTTPQQYNRLLVSVDKQIGYGVRDGYLGYTDELGAWIYETVQGLKILVQVVP